MGAGTRHRPLAAQAEASFGEAGWELSLEGASWAGRPGPVGARLWVHSSGTPTPPRVLLGLKEGVSTGALHADGAADVLGWTH